MTNARAKAHGAHAPRPRRPHRPAVLPARLRRHRRAPPAAGWAARAIVMVVDPHGDLCTGTALARDLVLTAAHCVRGRCATRSRPTRPAGDRGARHRAPPAFQPRRTMPRSRATADVALIKLAAPLPDVDRAGRACRRPPRQGRRDADHRRLRHHRRPQRARPRRAAHGDARRHRQARLAADPPHRPRHAQPARRPRRLHRRFRRAGLRRRKARW